MRLCICAHCVDALFQANQEQQPKPPDENPTVDELLDRFEGEILELRSLLADLREQFASL